MKFYVTFFFSVFFAFCCLAQETNNYKTIEFGFNIHYLNEAQKCERPLKQIKQDNFTKIRAFEPFTDSFSVNTSAFISKVKFIQTLDFELLLSLSNFIWQDDIDTSRLNISKLNREFIKEAIKYTNRYPPDDAEEYKLFLRNIMDSLQTNGCLKTMSFEIGNEPDADRYFWGDQEDWQKTAIFIADVLKPYSVSVACCGFSSDLIFLKIADRAPYLEYINSTDFQNNLIFSYHLYLESYLGKAAISDPQTTKVKNGVITEFGPATSLNADKTELMKSTGVMNFLVQLLEFAYANDVKTVYLFPLMDNKKHNTQMGYFDSEGNSKSAYKYLLKLSEVVNRGYTVYKTEDYIEIRGKESTLRLAKRTHKIQVEDIVFCTCNNIKQNKIKDGEWLIYKK